MPVKPVDSRLSEPAVLAVVFNSDSRLEREEVLAKIRLSMTLTNAGAIFLDVRFLVALTTTPSKESDSGSRLKFTS